MYVYICTSMQAIKKKAQKFWIFYCALNSNTIIVFLNGKKYDKTEQKPVIIVTLLGFKSFHCVFENSCPPCAIMYSTWSSNFFSMPNNGLENKSQLVTEQISAQNTPNTTGFTNQHKMEFRIRVTRWDCEELAQSVAQPSFRQT
jgi:hypothetical protein